MNTKLLTFKLRNKSVKYFEETIFKNLIKLKKDTFLSKMRNLVAIKENWRHPTVEIRKLLYGEGHHKQTVKSK